MSIFFTKILALLLSLPVSKYDIANEKPEDRRPRMEIIDESVETSVNRATCSEEFNIQGCRRICGGTKQFLAAYVISLARAESKLSSNIHFGLCLDNECDPYYSRGEIKHRAASLWQLHSSRLLPKEDWEFVNTYGLEQTKLAAWIATKLFCGFYTQYGDVGAFNIYL